MKTKVSQRDAAKAWHKEICRRIADVRSGKARMIPWDEVKRGIEKKLGK
ncbi:MAG TPA: addiction module protein [Planctomycetota bacterium]|nr:addiction module protein [Planctomycetota bacterium]